VALVFSMIYALAAAAQTGALRSSMQMTMLPDWLDGRQTTAFPTLRRYWRWSRGACHLLIEIKDSGTVAIGKDMARRASEQGR